MRGVYTLVASALVMTACQDQRFPTKQTVALSLDERVKKLESAEELRSLFDGADRVAYLTPSDRSYSLARADFGNVAAALENVESYADGVKIELKFGNTTSATVSGLKAKIEWGSVDASGSQTGKSQAKIEAFVEDLPAASWHAYSVLLPHLPANRLGFVRISEIQSASISLITR